MIPSSTLRMAYLQSIADALDAGGAAGRIKFYTGPQPANGATITTQTLLGTAALSYPAAAEVTATALTLGTIADLAVTADGDAVWARYETLTGAFVADATVGDATSTADIKLSRVGLVSGGYVEMTVAPINYPGA